MSFRALLEKWDNQRAEVIAKLEELELAKAKMLDQTNNDPSCTRSLEPNVTQFLPTPLTTAPATPTSTPTPAPTNR